MKNTSPDSTHLRSLTERALSAEKRAQHASNQLGQLEAKLAEVQGRAGKAEDKWEARVKEYENRLRIAGEKIKTEKQGGKERAMQLESQVRYVLSYLFMAFLC
jgi:peptidoglycan hydrolase CwlO-like protein